MAIDLNAQLQIKPGMLWPFLDFGVPLPDFVEYKVKALIDYDLPAQATQALQIRLDKIDPARIAHLFK